MLFPYMRDRNQEDNEDRRKGPRRWSDEQEVKNGKPEQSQT